MNGTLEAMIEKLERFITPKLSGDEHKRKEDSGEFTYIGLRPSEFIEQLEQFRQIHFQKISSGQRLKFVDVGCGIGSKLILAHNSWLSLVGIEIEPSYVEVARKLVPFADIRCQDAMSVDYGEFDVVYFYCPFRDLKKQAALEAHIVNTAKSGAYILANASVDLGLPSAYNKKNDPVKFNRMSELQSPLVDIWNYGYTNIWRKK